MNKIATSIEALEDDAAKARVLHWVSDRYPGLLGWSREASSRAGLASAPTPRDATEDLPEYFSHAAPESGVDKALVVAGWLQQRSGADIESATVNRELKHLGHPILNITRAFDELMARSPKLVVQVRKSGRTRQARKLYRVTHEGFAEIDRMGRAGQPQ